MSDKAFWQIVYRSLLAIAAAIKKYKIDASALVEDG
jgi:hypothetical protein